MDSEENKLSKLNEMGISITEHLADTAMTLDKDDDDNNIETLVVDLENKKNNMIDTIKLFYEQKLKTKPP